MKKYTTDKKSLHVRMRETSYKTFKAVAKRRKESLVQVVEDAAELIKEQAQ